MSTCECGRSPDPGICPCDGGGDLLPNGHCSCCHDPDPAPRETKASATVILACSACHWSCSASRGDLVISKQQYGECIEHSVVKP